MPRRRTSTALALLALYVIAAPPALADERTMRLAGRDVTLWSAGEESGAMRPVIVFSHGFHGCATQSRFLMEALAAAGYLVLAPDHRDAACGGGHARWRDRPDAPFRDPATWNEDSHRDRADDLREVLAAARHDVRFAHADWSRLGLAGHSLGGYTVLGLAGAWPGWRLGGVKAVLALSPYAQPFVARHSLGGLAAPVMYQGGTRDLGITPALLGPDGAYAQSPAPKLLLELDGAGHFAWTDLRRGAHAAITRYAVAFFDRYLRDLPAPELTEPRGAVARLLHEGA